MAKQRLAHEGKLCRLHAKDLDFQLERLECGCHTRDQTSATDRDYDDLDVGTVLDDLECQCALPRDDIGIVIGVDETEFALVLHLAGMRGGGRQVVTFEDDPRRMAFGLDHLDQRACATISGSSVQNFSTQDDGTEVETFTKRSPKR